LDFDSALMFERAIFARASVVSVLDVGCVKGFSFLNKRRFNNEVQL
jgi:hypothetical protein